MERAGRLIGTLKIAPELADPEMRLRAAWPKAAGTKVAPHTRVASLVRKTLIVEVEDFVWQKQLASLAHFFVSNLARETGEVLVEAIDFRPMPPRMRPQRASSAQPAAPVNRDEAERIDDPFLRFQYIKFRKKESA